MRGCDLVSRMYSHLPQVQKVHQRLFRQTTVFIRPILNLYFNMNTVAVTQKTADWHSVYVKFEMVHMAAVKNINTVGRWCLMLRHGFGFCFTAGAQDSRRFFSGHIFWITIGQLFFTGRMLSVSFRQVINQ